MEVPDDIFGDLVEGNSQPTTASPVSHNPSEEGFHLSIQPQFVLNSSLYNESSITSFLNFKSWTPLAYSQDDKFGYVLIDKNAYVSIQVYHLPHHATTSRPVLYHSFNTSLNSSLFKDDDGEKRYRSLYTLHQKVSLNDSQPMHSNDLESECSGNISLPQSLFVYLFGQEIACLNSTVMLLCCCNGDVFAYTMQSANDGKLQLLCSLRVPVVSIVLTVTQLGEAAEDEAQKSRNKILDSIKTSLESRLGNANVMKDRSMDGLLIVGRSGECCLFVRPPGPNVRIPAMFLLPDPVMSCITVGKHFIYSSGTCVKSCTLLLCKTEKQFSFSYRCHLLFNQAKIQNLQLRNFEDKQECHLLGITADYDAVTIAVLNKSSQGGFANFDSLDSAELDCHGKPTCLQDTLHRLNQHSETMKALQEKSLHLDSVLLQMNLFATISQQRNISKSNQQSSTQMKDYVENCDVLECGCELVPSKEGHMVWELRVKLVNKSSVSFSSDWSVIVLENPVFSSPLTYHLNSPMASSFRFMLDNGLQPRSEIDFIVPVVDSLTFDYLLELQVSVILILCLESFHEERATDSGVQNGKYCLLKVEICRQSFDILSFLQTSSSFHENKKYFQQENIEMDNWLGCQLSRMADGRIGGFHMEPVNSESEKLSFSVSVDLPFGYSDSRTDILMSFFNSRAHPHNETSCSLMSPSLQTLSISLDVCDDKELPLYHENRDRYCLKVKTQDVLLMFSVLEAVRRKIQSRMSKDRNTVSKEKLGNALQKLKHVRHLMRDNLNALKFGSGFYMDHMTLFCQFLEKLKSMNILELLTGKPAART